MSSRRPEEVLSALRSQLDELDTQIIDLLSRRIAVCREVAESKARHQIPMLQQQRIDSVKQRVTTLAAQKGLNERFVATLYDLIIGETCRIELKIIETRPQETSGAVLGHGASEGNGR
jgi:4-amino-4-deoxychorismate mutase